jgi:hypothetical protein
MRVARGRTFIRCENHLPRRKTTKGHTMKKLFAIAILLTLSACVTAPVPLAPLTPVQVAAQVCPPVQVALGSLQMLVGLPLGAQADLAAAVPLVAAVCSAGATANPASLQSLAQTALPLVLGVVKASALTAADQNNIVLAVGAAQIVIAAASEIVPVVAAAK